MVSSLILLIIVQNIIGKVNVIFWIPGMILAVMIMYMSILLTCQTDKLIAAYWLVRAFVLAEMTDILFYRR